MVTFTEGEDTIHGRVQGGESGKDFKSSCFRAAAP